jgi:hypothetical protein
MIVQTVKYSSYFRPSRSAHEWAERVAGNLVYFIWVEIRSSNYSCTLSHIFAIAPISESDIAIAQDSITVNYPEAALGRKMVRNHHI